MFVGYCTDCCACTLASSPSHLSPSTHSLTSVPSHPLSSYPTSLNPHSPFPVHPVPQATHPPSPFSTQTPFFFFFFAKDEFGGSCYNPLRLDFRLFLLLRIQGEGREGGGDIKEGGASVSYVCTYSTCLLLEKPGFRSGLFFFLATWGGGCEIWG